MISLFSNDESRDTAQAIQVAAAKPATSQPAYPKAQHPAVSKTVVAPAAPVPEKHGLFSWLSIGKAKKRLQMLETVSLGEKRFVALVQVDGRQFLIGGAPSNVGMIAELAPEESFHQVLRDATQGLNELPASTQAAQSAPVPAPAAEAAPVAAFAQPLSPAQAAPASAAFSAPVEPARPVAFTQAATIPSEPLPAAISVPAPVAAQPVVSAPVAAVAAPVAASVAVTTMPSEIATPAPIQHASVAPFALAEAVLPAAATFSPAPAISGKPSLPPHVAARLAELQAAIEAAPAPTASLIPDDLSLEEPVSLSPSLLAAMQQRARAALLNVEPHPAAPTMAVQVAPREGQVAVQKAAPAPAPSFTFQFSPMLTSTTQAVRMPGMKLQGAA